MVLKPNNTANESLCNLRVALKFCYNNLFKQQTTAAAATTTTLQQQQQQHLNYLTPSDLFYAHEQLLPNFIAFYSYLFYVLEINPNPQFVKRRGEPFDDYIFICVSIGALNLSSNCSKPLKYQTLVF